MALTEIEFELPPQQYAAMGFPDLHQGQLLTVVLETAVLMPEAGAENWFTVQPERLSPQFVQVGRAQYAFTGSIESAEFDNEDGVESAALVVRCGDVPLRVLCAPQADGRLPYGTWETRMLTGLARLYGVVEEDYAVGVGEPVDVTIWQFRRLKLGPGDAVFGQWHESDVLPASPFGHDRVVVTARMHRKGL